jgi:DNA invertase Pin-like site-specific DNA recombinase
MIHPKALVWHRVSTARQEAATQKLALRRYCDREGLQIVGWYGETVSGRDPSQLEFNRLQHDLRAHKGNVVVFWAWDRITRKGIQETLHIASLWKTWDIRWASLQEPFLSTGADEAVTELVLSIVGWAAKFEAGRISERTKAGLALAARKGHYPGRPKGSKDKRPRKRRWRRRPQWGG